MQDLKPETKPNIRAVLGMAEVAAHFDVTPRTIWNWAASGTFPAPHRVGRRTIFWDEEQIDNWIAQGCPAVYTQGTAK